MRLPKSRLGLYVALPLGSFVSILGLIYLLLMALQLHSTWRAVQTLDRLEAIRIGSSEAELKHALEYCQVPPNDTYTLTSGFNRVGILRSTLRRLPDDSKLKAYMALSRIGLRSWTIYVYPSLNRERVEKLKVLVFVDGSDRTLAADWSLAEQVSTTPYLDVDRLSLRTSLHGVHVTSYPGGEGFAIDSTPASTEKELRARRVNRRCLYSSRACENLCELLPDLPPVLQERKRWSQDSPTGIPLLDCER